MMEEEQTQEPAAPDERPLRPPPSAADAILDRVVRASRRGRTRLVRLLLGILYDATLTEDQQRRLRRAWRLLKRTGNRRNTKQ